MNCCQSFGHRIILMLHKNIIYEHTLTSSPAVGTNPLRMPAIRTNKADSKSTCKSKRWDRILSWSDARTVSRTVWARLKVSIYQ